MGGAVSAGEDNDELIDNLVEAEYIKSPQIERIFRAVDRGDYYLEGCKENAYRDLAWKHGNIHLSAPCIYSEVMESLKLGPGMSFLNLGSGTGYLSTMAGLVLGTYGVNHGVELHDEVVDYARNKLEDFQSTSPALDKYEFCPPSFVVGNCLLLDSSCHQYDRVYCGASCPSEHENYMKNLVRVGGILVMPLNDHLLQVTRTGETTYEVKNVLPVSFASLIPPHPSETQTVVKLPEKNPLKLQEICRSAIRILLRFNAEVENPSLKDRKKTVPSRRKRGKRRIRKVVIPVFDDSAQSDERSAADEKRSTTDENFVDVEPSSKLDDEQRLQDKELEDEYKQLFDDNQSEHSQPFGSCSTKESNLDDRSKVFDDCKEMPRADKDGRKALSLENSRRASSLESSHISTDDNDRGSHSEGHNINMSQAKLFDLMIASEREKLQREAVRFHFQHSQVNNSGGSSSQAEAMDTSDATAAARPHQTVNSDVMMEAEERVSNKDDSNGTQNVGNGDSGIDNISDDSVPEESSSDPEKTEGGRETRRVRPDPSTSHLDEDEDDDDDDDFRQRAMDLARHVTRLPPYLKRSVEENDDDEYTPRFCEKLRIAYSDADSDDFDDFESDSGKESFPKESFGTREKSDLSCYTYYMKQKINLLPLPQFLKMYLNFSRPV